MYTLCKLKEKADRAKKANALLSNLSNINKFIVEFEINDKVIKEDVGEHYIDSLKKIVETCYRTHIDIIFSFFSPLDFAYIKTRVQRVALQDKFTKYYLCGFVIDFDFADYFLIEEAKDDIYKGVIRYDKRELNPIRPNFCLTTL